MTAHGDFRSRALAMRAATQRKLVALRSEGLGKLCATRQSEPDGAFESDTWPDQRSERPTSLDGHPSRAQVNVPKPSLLPRATTERTVALGASLVQAMDHAVRSAGGCNAGRDQDEPIAPGRTDDAAIPASLPHTWNGPEQAPWQRWAHDDMPSGQPLVSDLCALPGAGPGLIWLLQRQNIHSMSDLARADADQLSHKLNLVGQLLDMEGWIDFAKHHQRSIT